MCVVRPAQLSLLGQEEVLGQEAGSRRQGGENDASCAQRSFFRCGAGMMLLLLLGLGERRQRQQPRAQARGGRQGGAM